MKNAWIILIILTTFRLNAQNEPYYRLLTKAQGLPSHTIYSMEEDHYGRILLGTEKGLFRYNGIHFKELKCPENHSGAIANLRKINRSTFLAHNFSGQLFQLSGDSLSLFPLPELPAEIFNIRIQGDSLLVISLDQVILYRLKTRKVLRTFKPSNKTQHFFTARFTSAGISFLYTDGDFRVGKRLFKTKNNLYYNFHELNHRFLLQPIYGNLANPSWFDNGKQTDLCKTSFHGNPKFYDIHVINHKFYLCTQSGVICYNPKNQKTDNWFPEYQVTHVLKDQKGNYWFSTLNKGLLFVPNIEAVKLSDEPALSIVRSRNTSFCGNSYGKVDAYDSEGKLIRKYLPSESMIEASFIEVDGNLLRTNTCVFDIATGKQLNKGFEFLKHYTRDSKYNFYLAKPYGLLVIPHEEIQNPGEEYSFTGNVRYLKNIRTKDVIFDDHQHLIAACIDGVHYWKDGKEHRLRYHNKAINASRLAFQNGTLYISTYEFGLLVYKDFQLQEVIDTRKGLNSNHILKTVRNRKGLFILTDEDFYVRKSGETTCVSVKSALGFHSLELNDFFLDRDTCYFATDQGVIYIPIFNAQLEIPEIVIRKIELNNRIYPLNTRFIANYEENDLKLSFEAIAYKNAENIEINYQLFLDGEAASSSISLPASSKNLYLSSLKSGDYKLVIRVSDRSSNLNSAVRVIRFTILKPWYFRWYFILLWIVLIISVSSLFWWLRSAYVHQKYQKKLEQQQLKRELAEARLTALRAQMNPHFMYNVLNSIQSLVYADKHNEASYYLGKFADLTRRFLELSSRENVTIKQECETLQIYLELEKMRFGDEFTYSIESDPSIDPTFQEIPTLLLQPFVENSLKHGLLHKKGNKRLEIQFRLKGKFLEIRVRDNGIGRAHAEKINQRNKESKTSYATNAVKHKLELLNRLKAQKILLEITDLHDENGIPTGTEVKLIIPIPDEMYTH